MNMKKSWGRNGQSVYFDVFLFRILYGFLSINQKFRQGILKGNSKF